MSHNIPPAHLARYDQLRAERREQLATLVTLARLHADAGCEHGCVGAAVNDAITRHDPATRAQLLSIAVAELARREPQGQP
ncbi:MAG: hypothetical protein ACRDQ7_15645 [Haloechinothrix sp.]